MHGGSLCVEVPRALVTIELVSLLSCPVLQDPAQVPQQVLGPRHGLWGLLWLERLSPEGQLEVLGGQTPWKWESRALGVSECLSLTWKEQCVMSPGPSGPSFCDISGPGQRQEMRVLPPSVCLQGGRGHSNGD